MRKRDDKRQDNSQRNMTSPPRDVKRALEEFWRTQLNRIKERAELHTVTTAEAVDPLKGD